MIVLQNIYKKYTKNRNNFALQDISLHIEKGDIFGIIGFSGAGKSSLLRTINLLERPTSGNVIIDGVVLNNLNNLALAKERKNIGMIFQHFNLLYSKNVYKNIVLPLELNKLPKKFIQERAEEVINLVGLEKHTHSYPSEISGGQKQRVGIARALTNHPKVLLCDEITSALDPVSTLAILQLLKDIHKKIDLTIVLITHELQVIQAICNKVAVLDKGTIIDVGETHTVLNNPTHKITKLLLSSDKATTEPYDYEITVSLSRDDNNLHFIRGLANHGTVKLIRSNLNQVDDSLQGTVTLCLRINNENAPDIENILSTCKVADFSIMKSKG